MWLLTGTKCRTGDKNMGSFFETIWGKTFIKDCHTVENVEIASEYGRKNPVSKRKLVWKVILLLTFSINGQEI